MNQFTPAGFVFDGVQDWGQPMGRVLAFTRRDAPLDDPRRGITFYVPENSTPEAIEKRAAEKMTEFLECNPSR